ncbi:ABC transporter permease [Roseobacter sp. HKCCA0434]|uniref:ABC transporter permease n=1 Tax=Roseobacter sp. HKCCA0434 TaxID=3079297 RepID=UPI002905F16D|nr:ABC transporter permease [Roseobacter sp. HKCCA0434]
MPQFQRYHRAQTFWESLQSLLDIIYISIVRSFRTDTGGSLLGFVSLLIQPLILFFIFYVIFEVFGRLPAIRGDFLLFMMTGIFLYRAHIQAVTNLKGAGHATSGMMFYAKTSTLISILSAALNQLYIVILSVIVIMTTAYLIRGYLEVYNPPGLILPFFMAWASGLAVGLLFMAFTPFAPGVIPKLFQVYRRLQMVTSGKMFVANTIPAAILPFFAWNPLFHSIDQARGHAFINYLPKKTSIEYPIYFTLAALAIGFTVEFAMRARQNYGIE